MQPNGSFEKLLSNKTFNSHIISIIIDEAHCVSNWGTFQPEYHEIGCLHYLQCKLCLILATSATMSAGMIDDVKKVLHLCEESLFISQCSTDRTNIKILIRPILNPIHTFRDLSFVLCDWKLGNPPPPKFLIFFDNINESILAGLFLQCLLPKDQHHCIKWFNSEKLDGFKWNEAGWLVRGKTWGLMATDSFGMVSVMLA